MRSAKSTGRIVGALLLLQLACGLMLPFILWHPLIRGVPAFLADAAGMNIVMFDLAIVGLALSLFERRQLGSAARSN